MARNGSGTMTIVNSFTPGTTISSADMNENFTDIAAELTNSVAKDGQTVMTGVLKAANGSVTNPSYTFGSDLNSGLYRIGADNIGVAVNGTKILDIAATGLSITGTLTPSGQIVSAAGDASGPGYSFAGDLNSGFYHIGADNIALSLGGSKVVDFLTTGITVTGLVTTDDITVTDDAAIAGDVAINTDKFTVAGASGNTAIAGTLSVTGASTMTGALTANNAAGVLARNTIKASAYFTASGATITFTDSEHFNVASIVHSTTGQYAVTFTNALPTDNYVVVPSGREAGGASVAGHAVSRTVNGFTVVFTDIVAGSGINITSADFIVVGF